jgi:hypothetical protein
VPPAAVDIGCRNECARSAHTTEEELHMPATTTVGVRYMMTGVIEVTR